jgi:hypothetical protein
MNPRILCANEPQINIEKQASSPIEDLDDVLPSQKILINDHLKIIKSSETPITQQPQQQRVNSK